MNRGRKPKPSVTFYMRSSEYGDIKILFTYERERYACGSTYISLDASDFNRLKSNGSPKNPKNPMNPRIANGILVSDLLSYLRKYIINRVEEKISFKEPISEEFMKELCSAASKSMFEQLKVWSSNLEWNRRLHKAMSSGKKSLSKFYEENLSKMFSIESTNDGE